ncbi:hypothetical protein ACSBR1_041829 [Camellia fascicularis]
MGCVCMKQQRGCENPAKLAAQTHFNVTDIKALYELFKKLSSSVIDDGFISKEEFQLGLFRNSKKQSLFADRMSIQFLIFNLFDTKNDGVIEFGEFVRSLSIFPPDAPCAEKAACMKISHFIYVCACDIRKTFLLKLRHDVTVAFQLYDIWETSFIKSEEEKPINTLFALTPVELPIALRRYIVSSPPSLTVAHRLKPIDFDLGVSFLGNE